jgi:site-specific recombinase XerD
MGVSELAELTNFSKAYISNVKNGKKPPSEKLIQKLLGLFGEQNKNGQIENEKAISLFLKSRRNGISPKTKVFYQCYLDKAIPILGLSPTSNAINGYFNSLPCSVGGKHAYYRAVSVFFNWLYSPKSGLNFDINNNPILLIDPPKRPKLILPSLSKEQVNLLIEKAHCVRDKAIISLFAESGLRLSELVGIKLKDINWDNKTIRVIGKGSKEGYAPFGSMSEQFLKEWFNRYNPQFEQNIWDIRFWGVKFMLDELRKETGLPCNPHTFRRTFACLLRKAGLDSLTIKDLGRWESLEMVQRYTRSIGFNDSLKFYKAPLS